MITSFNFAANENILNTAVKDVAELVDGVDLYILVVTQAVDLGTVHVVVCVKVILGHVSVFHRLPQTVISDHPAVTTFTALDFTLLLQ
jgi:hypothetical protein